MKIKLKECVQLVKDRTSIENVDLASYISTDNMLPNRKGVDFNKSSKPKAKTVLMYQKGDVLISNIRPYFKKIWMADRNGTRSGDILAFRVNKSGILQKYLYCILQSDIFFDYVMASAKGTKMPRGDKNAILDFEFEVPSIEKQKKVYKPILTIEKKINLNNKINTNLLEIIRNNFLNLQRSLTLQELSLSNLASVIDNRGKTPPLVKKSEYPLLDVKTIQGDGLLPQYNLATKFVSEDTYNNWFRSGHPKYGDVLLSTVGTIGESKLFLQEKGTIAQNVIALRPLNTLGYYLFELIQYIKPILTSFNIGSVQPSIKVTQFMEYKVNCPSFKDINKWEEQNAELFTLIKNNVIENEILTKLKKELLMRYF